MWPKPLRLRAAAVGPDHSERERPEALAGALDHAVAHGGQAGVDAEYPHRSLPSNACSPQGKGRVRRTPGFPGPPPKREVLHVDMTGPRRRGKVRGRV